MDEKNMMKIEILALGKRQKVPTILKIASMSPGVEGLFVATQGRILLIILEFLSHVRVTYQFLMNAIFTI